MRLLTLLLIRLAAIVLLCLAVSVGWIIRDTYREIEADVAATSERIGQHLQMLHLHHIMSRMEWETLSTQSLISPGVCVTYGPPQRDVRTVCSQLEAIGPLPPDWFSAAYMALFGAHQPVQQYLSVREKDAGLVITYADQSASLRRAWHEISTVVRVSVLMAAGIALLAAFMIGHALMPANTIVEALHKLEDGRLRRPIGGFKSAEFDHIANAVNRLRERLQQTNAERLALTARLFQVQEEERRALARDLHDEFGQAFAATSALAALIETNAPGDRPDIAEDARSILRTQQQIMDTLRTTLVRLRSQSIEEVGLEASLRQLVSDFNRQTKAGTVYRLQIISDLARLPKRAAIDVYRIVQECLTNACKHGKPSEVTVRLEIAGSVASELALTIEDDGGGDAGRIQTSIGHGIIGIRERLAALGGAMSIGNARQGIRITATVPLGASELGA